MIAAFHWQSLSASHEDLAAVKAAHFVTMAWSWTKPILCVHRAVSPAGAGSYQYGTGEGEAVVHVYNPVLMKIWFPPLLWNESISLELLLDL